MGSGTALSRALAVTGNRMVCHFQSLRVKTCLFSCRDDTPWRISAFADLFALTSAEARVVSQLVSRGRLTKVAACLNIALSTARSHLKHILGHLEKDPLMV